MVPADLERLAAEAGVSAVLCVQHDDCFGYWGIDYPQMRALGGKLGLQMARSPMRDFDLADQRSHLPAAVAALAGLQARGHRTYVHCTAGLGRSPLTVLGYLTWIEGQSLDQALGLIRRARPGAVPALEAYHGCRADLVERHRFLIERLAFERFRARGGHPGHAESDWLAAEGEALKQVLSPGGSPAA
jgi:hypothetical protein